MFTNLLLCPSVTSGVARLGGKRVGGGGGSGRGMVEGRSYAFASLVSLFQTFLHIVPQPTAIYDNDDNDIHKT